MVTLRLQRQLVKLFERGNLHCGASVHWSVETRQQQIQFTECCDHLWLSSLSLLYCDFSAFILKFAVIIFTLVKTINHITPKPKQFCPLFTLFPLLVWLEHAYSSYSEIFSNLKCSEICFDALCIFWLGASLVWNESGFASKLLGYFSCAHSLGKLCTCDIQKATYLLDFFYAKCVALSGESILPDTLILLFLKKATLPTTLPLQWHLFKWEVEDISYLRQQSFPHKQTWRPGAMRELMGEVAAVAAKIPFRSLLWKGFYHLTSVFPFATAWKVPYWKCPLCLR